MNPVEKNRNLPHFVVRQKFIIKVMIGKYRFCGQFWIYLLPIQVPNTILRGHGLLLGRVQRPQEGEGNLQVLSCLTKFRPE